MTARARWPGLTIGARTSRGRTPAACISRSKARAGLPAAPAPRVVPARRATGHCVPRSRSSSPCTAARPATCGRRSAVARTSTTSSRSLPRRASGPALRCRRWRPSTRAGSRSTSGRRAGRARGAAADVQRPPDPVGGAAVPADREPARAPPRRPGRRPLEHGRARARRLLRHLRAPRSRKRARRPRMSCGRWGEAAAAASTSRCGLARMPVSCA